MNIFGEMHCYGQCLQSWAIIAAFIVAISIAAAAVGLMHKNPRKRLQIFAIAQIAGILTTTAIFYLMECSYMLTLYLYFAYAAASTIFIFGMLHYYDRLLVKRLGAKPAVSILKWTQEFVDRLASAKVFYFDSAVPRAFAAGRSIFVSVGLIEILDDDEIKAVLAHEAWHIKHNSRMLSPLMAFSSSSQPELEFLADRFAAEIAGKNALSSARNKVDKVFI